MTPASYSDDHSISNITLVTRISSWIAESGWWAATVVLSLSRRCHDEGWLAPGKRRQSHSILHCCSLDKNSLSREALGFIAVCFSCDDQQHRFVWAAPDNPSPGPPRAGRPITVTVTPAAPPPPSVTTPGPGPGGQRTSSSHRMFSVLLPISVAASGPSSFPYRRRKSHSLCPCKFASYWVPERNILLPNKKTGIFSAKPDSKKIKRLLVRIQPNIRKPNNLTNQHVFLRTSAVSKSERYDPWKLWDIFGTYNNSDTKTSLWLSQYCVLKYKNSIDSTESGEAAHTG